MEQINETTLYLRIPSFDESYKRSIDSVLAANNKRILVTKKLIIDIRNNGGGSDNAYAAIIPYLYTNPIRSVGVEFLSTKLNNQRMLDFIDKPEYGFNEEEKKWAKKAYDTLKSKIGQFVSVNQNVISVDQRDTVYPYPFCLRYKPSGSPYRSGLSALTFRKGVTSGRRTKNYSLCRDYLTPLGSYNQKKLQPFANRRAFFIKTNEVMGNEKIRVEIGVPNADSAKASLVLFLIEQDYSKSWSIAQLAKKAGLYERRLQQIFKRVYGTTVRAYVMELRLRKSHALLLESDAKLKVICEQVGFADASNFSAAFKKLFGYPPGRLRRASLAHLTPPIGEYRKSPSNRRGI